MRTQVRRSRLRVRRAAFVLGAGALLLTGGCRGSGEPTPAPSSPLAADSGPASPASTSRPAGAANPSSGAPATTPSSSPPPSSTPTSTCADQVLGRLTLQERVGQLLMVAVPAKQPGSVEPTLRDYHVGGVFYLGGWRGAGAVTATSAAVQRQATTGVGLLVAADQEGGRVQQLRGSGFTDLPTPVVQKQLSQQELTQLWTRVGHELSAAGVNVDLAPVADVVAAGQEAVNAPIGKYGRHYGSTPAEAASAVTGVVTGLISSDVTATVKHFPGLGRVSGNTDVTATGITDDEAGPDDANLQPFRAGIVAGAGLVMVSSARYPRVDPANAALFSPAVVTGLLRGTLGYAGVVVSDDVGVAAAVASVPVGERATRFLGAGGDLVLTADASQVPVMVSAVEGKAQHDPAFARQLDASVRRVLALKDSKGLLHCS